MSLKRLTKFFVLGLVTVLGISTFRAFFRVNESQRQTEIKKQQLKEEEKENARLKRFLEEVESLEFVEKEARDKLGLAKKGEVVVILPDEDTLRLIAPKLPQEEEKLKLDPTWKKWLKLFF